MFNNQGYFQLQAQIMLQTLYMIYHGSVRPLVDKQQQNLVTLNEIATMIVNYHLVCLTWFVDIKYHWEIAENLKKCVMVNVVINFTAMFYNVTRRSIRDYKLKKAKLIWKDHVKVLMIKRIK